MGVPEILALVEKGGVAGLLLAAIAVVATICAGLFLKNRAVVSVTEKSSIVDRTQIDSIQSKLGEIEKRMSGLEFEVHDRATRTEVHAMEISLERLDGRMNTMAAELKAVGAGVSRIEDFMLSYSGGGRRD